MTIYLLCLVLFCVGLYCILRKRNIIKIIVGIIITEYAVNLFFILVAYRWQGRAPILSPEENIANMVDPLPAYFVLECLIDSFRPAGNASCSLTNKDSALVFHAILHPSDF